MTLYEFNEYVRKHEGKPFVFFKYKYDFLLTKCECIICASNNGSFDIFRPLVLFNVMYSITKNCLKAIYDYDDFSRGHPEVLKYKGARYSLNCAKGGISYYLFQNLCIPTEDDIRELYKHLKYDYRGI